MLRGKVLQLTELSGGLTNRNLEVRTDDDAYVARMFRDGGELLAIDRDAERENTHRAAQAGVAADVVAFSAEEGVLLIEFLDGETFTEDRFARPGVAERAAVAVRALHDGPRFVNDFHMPSRQRQYLGTVREHGFDHRRDYTDHEDAFARVCTVLADTAGPTVPCNNDLLAGNFIDGPERVHVIDYEYSGNNDPHFELGNIVTESDLDDEVALRLVAAYLGLDGPEDVPASTMARIRLQTSVSEYGWALWGYIQAATSPLDFDFRAWGDERFEKAARTFTGDTFERLLATAAETSRGAT